MGNLDHPGRFYVWAFLIVLFPLMPSLIRPIESEDQNQTSETRILSHSSDMDNTALNAAKEFIRQHRYDQATNKLEEVLERSSNHAEALMYLGTVYLYKDLDHLKAMKWFENSLKLGGGAAFLVQHSHPTFGGNQLADYCRGWLILRGDEVEFTPDNGTHGFRESPADLKEFKQNRLQQSMFHIKRQDSNFNFHPFTGGEDEALLIMAMYKKLSRSNQSK